MSTSSPFDDPKAQQITASFAALRPSSEGVEAFQKLFLARFGRDLSVAEAEDLSSRYLQLYALGAQSSGSPSPSTPKTTSHARPSLRPPLDQ